MFIGLYSSTVYIPKLYMFLVLRHMNILGKNREIWWQVETSN
jgi:hypothetical protein